MTLTTQQKLEAITARICEVVPEIEVWGHTGVVNQTCLRCRQHGGGESCKRPITLEDILRFFDTSLIAVCSHSGNIYQAEKIDSTTDKWTFVATGQRYVLGKPLHKQDSSTIDWLYFLLPSSTIKQ